MSQSSHMPEQVEMMNVAGITHRWTLEAKPCVAAMQDLFSASAERSPAWLDSAPIEHEKRYELVQVGERRTHGKIIM